MKHSKPCDVKRCAPDATATAALLCFLERVRNCSRAQDTQPLKDKVVDTADASSTSNDLAERKQPSPQDEATEGGVDIGTADPIPMPEPEPNPQVEPELLAEAKLDADPQAEATTQSGATNPETETETKTKTQSRQRGDSEQMLPTSTGGSASSSGFASPISPASPGFPIVIEDITPRCYFSPKQVCSPVFLCMNTTTCVLLYCVGLGAFSLFLLRLFLTL